MPAQTRIVTREELLERVNELAQKVTTDPRLLPSFNKPNALDTIDLVLRTVKEASAGCPIPALRGVAGVVVVVLDAVQAVKRNRNEFVRLAEDAFEVAYVIITQYQNPETKEWKSMPQNLENHLFRLLERALVINERANKQRNKHWLKLALIHRPDIDAINDCRVALDHAKSVFQIKVTLSIHDTTLEIAQTQLQILKEIKELREQKNIQFPQNTEQSPPQRPSPTTIQSSSGTITVTTVGGNYTANDSSQTVTNTNSGNTTTTTISNAYNDWSHRAGRSNNPFTAQGLHTASPACSETGIRQEDKLYTDNPS